VAVVPRAERAAEPPKARSLRFGDHLTIAGRPLVSKTTGTVLLWMSDEPVERVLVPWAVFATQFARRGVWPVIVRADAAPKLLSWIGKRRPTDPGSHDVLAVLREHWDSVVPYGDDARDWEQLAPFREELPGLAAPGQSVLEPAPFLDPAKPPFRALTNLDGNLALISTTRAGDVPARLGWVGGANYDLDPGELSAVMRSWEDRFGAFLVGITADTLIFGVEHPPRDRDHALAVAAEHVAICPDVIQDSGTLALHADGLVNNPAWRLWWD
jgi:Domain of unknown function (DUF4253)